MDGGRKSGPEVGIPYLANGETPARGPISIGHVEFPTGVHSIRCAQHLAPILARLLHGASSKAAIVCVTGVSEADRATYVARLVAATAARLPWCRTLLLDAYPEDEPTRDVAVAGRLPNLLESLAQRGLVEVAIANSGRAEFHIAAIPPGPAWMAGLVSRALRDQLLPAYRLIVVDCPPVLDQPFLPPLVEAPSVTVLVLRARRTPIKLAVRTKREIESIGGTLLGVIMTEDSSPTRKFLRWTSVDRREPTPVTRNVLSLNEEYVCHDAGSVQAQTERGQTISSEATD